MALLVAVVGVTTIITLLFLGPVTSSLICDGAVPVWMLEEQGYAGGGCAWVLPSSEAPPGADWRVYCTAMCDPAQHPANQDYVITPSGLTRIGSPPR